MEGSPADFTVEAPPSKFVPEIVAATFNTTTKVCSIDFSWPLAAGTVALDTFRVNGIAGPQWRNPVTAWGGGTNFTATFTSVALSGLPPPTLRYDGSPAAPLGTNGLPLLVNLAFPLTVTS
jgi:hypothetical protein